MLWRRRIARSWSWSWPAAGEHAINYLVLLGRKNSTASIVYCRMAWAACVCVHVLLRLHVLLRCALNEVCGAWAMAAAAAEAAVAGTRSTGRKGRALLRQE